MSWSPTCGPPACRRPPPRRRSPGPTWTASARCRSRRCTGCRTGGGSWSAGSSPTGSGPAPPAGSPSSTWRTRPGCSTSPARSGCGSGTAGSRGRPTRCWSAGWWRAPRGWSTSTPTGWRRWRYRSGRPRATSVRLRRVERTQSRPLTPRTAVVWAALRPEIERRESLLVLDVGGGTWAAAPATLAAPDGRTGRADKLRRRFDADGAAALLRSAGLTVEAIHGVRVLADLLPGAVADADPEALVAFELAAADRPPFRDIATQLHLYARKPW